MSPTRKHPAPYEMRADEVPLGRALAAATAIVLALAAIGTAVFQNWTLRNVSQPVPPLTMRLMGQLPTQVVAPMQVALPPPPLDAPEIAAPPMTRARIRVRTTPHRSQTTPSRTSRHAQPVPTPAPTPAPAPAPQADTPPLRDAPHPAPPPGERGARDSLEARIRAAIQTAFHYPEAARAMGDEGTAVVAFSYRDRVASGVRVLHSSGIAILDEAAVAIVRRADLPPPSAALASVTLALEVPVTFHAVSDDD